MDVKVTIPKGYKDLSVKLAGGLCYWRISGFPRNVEPGEFIYFIRNSQVQYKATIVSIDEGAIDFERMHRLPKPHQPHIGFQGFRYVRKHDQMENS